MAGVAGQLLDHVDEDPAQGEGAAAVVQREVVEVVAPRRCGGTPRPRPGSQRSPRRSCRRRSGRTTRRRRSGQPTSSRERPASETGNQTCSTNVACLTSARRLVFEGTRRRRACSSVSPSRRRTTSARLSSRNASTCSRSDPTRVDSVRYSGSAGTPGPYDPSVRGCRCRRVASRRRSASLVVRARARTFAAAASSSRPSRVSSWARVAWKRW